MMKPILRGSVNLMVATPGRNATEAFLVHVSQLQPYFKVMQLFCEFSQFVCSKHGEKFTFI